MERFHKALASKLEAKLFLEGLASSCNRTLAAAASCSVLEDRHGPLYVLRAF